MVRAQVRAAEAEQEMNDAKLEFVAQQEADRKKLSEEHDQALAETHSKYLFRIKGHEEDTKSLLAEERAANARLNTDYEAHKAELEDRAVAEQERHEKRAKAELRRIFQIFSREHDRLKADYEAQKAELRLLYRRGVQLTC